MAVPATLGEGRTGASLVRVSTFFLSSIRSKELLLRTALNEFGGGLGDLSSRSMTCFERSVMCSHVLAASSAHGEPHSGEASDALTPGSISVESAGTRTAKTSPASICTPTSCCDATFPPFLFGSESKEQLLRRENPLGGELLRMVAFGVVRAALGGELLRIVAFGVVGAAFGGELLRTVALGGVCGATSHDDRLNDFTSLTCFGRSVLCGDVLAVSGAHSDGASRASTAAGIISVERAPLQAAVCQCSPQEALSCRGQMPFLFVARVMIASPIQRPVRALDSVASRN